MRRSPTIIALLISSFTAGPGQASTPGTVAPASVDFILISIGIFAGIVVFAVVVATILLKNTSLLRLKPRQAADRIRALEHELAMARAMMVAEPQIVVKLEGEADGEIIANTLDPATSPPRLPLGCRRGGLDAAITHNHCAIDILVHGGAGSGFNTRHCGARKR